MQSGSSGARQKHPGQIQQVLEYSRNENHFDVNAQNMEQQASSSYKNVVPSEYDYMQGQAPRTIFQQRVPIKVEVERPRHQAGTPSNNKSNFSIADMYQGLDQPSPKLKKAKTPRRKQQRIETKDVQDSVSQGVETTTSTAMTSMQEKKNPFWDSLDPANWVDDAMVKSCQYCQHDFTFTRRRHHCRKCGNIFCNEHCIKKLIQGLTAKICTQCLREYEQYSQHLQTMMISKMEHKREQDEEQTTQSFAPLLPLPEDYQRFVNDSSHIIDDISNRSMNQPALRDYMAGAFASKQLPDNLVVESGELLKSEQAKSIGFEPIIDPNSSLVQGSVGPANASMLYKDQPHMDSAPIMDSKKSYMDEAFGGNKGSKLINSHFGNDKPVNQKPASSQIGQFLHSMASDESFQGEAQQSQNTGASSVSRLMEFSKRHIQKVVTEQLFLNDLSQEKWEKLLTQFVMKAVEQVKPSSRMLGDSMDINECIKVKIIDWKDNSRSAYINGIVMSKSIASKRMQTTIVNPRILLLRALDQDEARNPNFVIPDLATKIDVEGHTDKILEQKLSKINPNLVVIQKDISVKLMNMMREKKITVVCNLPDRKMKRLARLTQTIVLPSINVIDSSFSLGHSKLFREDNLSRQLRGQDAYFTNTHTVEQTLLVFDGCNPVLGCTICLSGPMQKEGQELIKVKKALQQMLTLAKNIVLERHFLMQIQCIVPEPPMDNDELWQEELASQSSMRSLKHMKKQQQVEQSQGDTDPVLEDVIGKWEMTDIFSPYLITNFVSNRSRMVYKKIKIALKQRDEPIPSGPTGYEREDIPEDLNDTMSNFIRENTDTPSNRDTFNTQENFNKPFVMSDGRLKINEKYVQTKLDKMCGEPKDAILTFSRQNTGGDNSKERSDQTLGKYLEELAETARVKCPECNLEKFQHSQEIYHRDGQIQITIKPPQLNNVQAAMLEQQTYNLANLKPAKISSTEKTGLQEANDQNNQNHNGNPRMHQASKKKIQIYASCKTCARYCARSLVSSQLYEYSKARFFEQFFYNDKLKVKNGIFGCEHGAHPLRDYIIEFSVEQCKIQFRYTQIETYQIQIVNPKNFKSRESLRQLVTERKERLQDLLEKALENFKLDQVGVLKKQIELTKQNYDMDNQNKFKGTNMSVFVNHFNTIMSTLESMQNDFHVFQEEASKELAKFHDQLLHLMFLKRKILMTFLGYQRAIDETIQQLALLIVCARRRAQVIEYQLSHAGPQDQPNRKTATTGSQSQYGIIIDGEEHSVHLQHSQATHSNNRETALFGGGNNQQAGPQSIQLGVSMEESPNTTAQYAKKHNLSGADIVQEEEEKESDEASQVHGDEMASVGLDQLELVESDGSHSDTEIRQIHGEFVDDNQSSGGRSSKSHMKPRGVRKRLGFNQKSNSSDVDFAAKQAQLSRSIDEMIGSDKASNRNRKYSNVVKSKSKPFGSNTNASMASLSSNNPHDLAMGKRRLQVTSCQEDSMEEDDDNPINDFKRHCFIEELCTCEIYETPTQDQQMQASHVSPELKLAEHQLHQTNIVHQMSAQLQRRVSSSERFMPGEFKGLLKQHTMDPSEDKKETKAMFDLPDSSQPSGPTDSSKFTATETDFFPVVHQSMRYPGEVASPLVKDMASGSVPIQTSVKTQGVSPRNVRRPVTFCHMSGHVSLNKYCSIVAHVVPCYQKIMMEVAEMRNLLEKAIYLPQEEQKQAMNGLMSWYTKTNEMNKKLLVLDENDQVSPPVTDDVKFNQHHRDQSTQFLKVMQTSQTDGFDMIAVEKKANLEDSQLQDIDASMHEGVKKQNNRQGGDLRDDFDFIKVPKAEKPRGDSPAPNKNMSKIDQTGKVNVNRESKQVIEPPLQDKWLHIKWIRCLSKKSYPTLPFGVDNIYLNVDPNDLGSIIAYALTSNIYLEGLARLNYMDLQEVLLKQKEKNNHTNYELLDKDDVLNYKHISNKQMENEMLSRNRISFAIKFSTHSKDVSISIKDGREWHNQNHSERHYRTGTTDKRTAQKKLTQQDLQSVVSQSDTRTLKGSIKTDLSKPSVRTKGSKPEIKSKKVFNDFHTKVLPKYPKEYLKQQNITDVINDLEEVQSDLCRSYFSQDQITAINHFVNKKLPVTQSPLLFEQQNQNNTNQMESASNISMAFGNRATGEADQSMQYLEHENSFYQQANAQGNNMMENSIDLSNADFAIYANQTLANQTAETSFNVTSGFERTQMKNIDKRKMKKFVKEQGTKLHEKEENVMKLEEGTIFGVKSPAQQFIAEQTNATKFINEELKIPKIDFEVRIFYPKRFSGMRRFYIGSHLDYIMSICKTKTWASSGGKASMGFFTTHDKKFVFKSVKKEEFEMFCQFAPTYFDYMAKAFFHDYPCCLAKIIGAYEIIINCETNSEYNSRTYILVSENLNLGLKKEDEQNIIRFDLKGSENNRLVTPPMGPDGRPERVVLLDNNFLYKMRARPVVLSFEDAQNLHICISNDIDQLQKMNIVDYSLLAVIDTRRKKIRFAILDYCQFFNSKKTIEYLYKHTVYLGGLPTIVPADIYRMRFMSFMTKYFMGVSRQDTKKQDGRKRTTKEQARRTIMVQDAEIESIVRSQTQMEEIQAVMREVNQSHDNQEQTINRAANLNSLTLPKANSIENISGASHSPMMH